MIQLSVHIHSIFIYFTQMMTEILKLSHLKSISIHFSVFSVLPEIQDHAFHDKNL